MEFRGPSAKDAWVGDQKIRHWFEIVIDTARDPHEHRAYICKNCWQMFDADDDLWALGCHVEAHER